MSKGFTYIELLLVLLLLTLIGTIVFSVIRVQAYFARARDTQRINDLQSIFSAIQLYLNSTSTPDLDGPKYFLRGTDEVWSSIFISVPTEDTNLGNLICLYDRPYVIIQADHNKFRNIDGEGWLPIDFSYTPSPFFSSLPIDPINNYQSGFYYIYAFRRNPIQFELSAKLESREYSFGGVSDITSTDNGNDPHRFEIGSNLNVIPPL